jgi:hypothetical protein
VQIFSEPLVPRLKIRSIGDNPYASVHEHVDSWWNAAAVIALISKALLPTGSPRQQVERLRHAIDAFHDGEPEVCRASHVMSADCCVLLSSMYPVEYDIAKESILPAYSVALKTVVRSEAMGTPTTLPAVLSPELLGQAREYWDRFTRKQEGAWGRVAPLVEELVRIDGRFDATLHELNNIRRLNDTALRACWCVASSDGKKPPPDTHPLHEMLSPQNVDRVTIAPVYCAKQTAGGEWIYPRGALVGMRPGSFRSLLSMMIATDRVDDVTDVQIFRNEGGLLLRPSSAADIADMKGNQRSDKSCSPVGVEGDSYGFGSRESKLIGCRLQRQAWETNLLRLMPLCAKVALPRPADTWRYRGDEESLAIVKQNVNKHRLSGIETYEQRLARATMEKVVQHCRTGPTATRLARSL